MKVHSWRGQRFLGMFQRITEAGQCVVGYESLQGDLREATTTRGESKDYLKKRPQHAGDARPIGHSQRKDT